MASTTNDAYLGKQTDRAETDGAERLKSMAEGVVIGPHINHLIGKSSDCQSDHDRGQKQDGVKGGRGEDGESEDREGRGDDGERGTSQKKIRRTISVLHVDIIGDSFWEVHPDIIGRYHN